MVSMVIAKNGIAVLAQCRAPTRIVDARPGINANAGRVLN
jgi:hypothetical protein